MKKAVLEKLKSNSSQYISGEALSIELNVSRTAIWKCIKEFKKEGYNIESSSKKGYRLVSTPDILNSYEISEGLNTEWLGKNIHYLSVVDSTNSYAKKLALEGCEDGTLVIADSQTSGRGRLGRLWSSSDKKGIWMSAVLRPKVSPEDVQIITLAASIAVVNAIYEITGIKAGIKWPNDIVLNGKKVCGILTEMNSEMEQVNFLVLGIGINVNQDIDDFPEELHGFATSLKMFNGESSADEKKSTNIAQFKRSDIIKRLLFELEHIYSKIIVGLSREVIEEWNKHSITIGKEVRVILRNDEHTGIAKAITPDGKLVVSCSDGITREITSGEVSVRGILGYV